MSSLMNSSAASTNNKQQMDDKMLKVVLVQNFLQRMAVSNEIDRLPSQTKSVVVQSGPASSLAASLEAATRELKVKDDFKKHAKIGWLCDR